MTEQPNPTQRQKNIRLTPEQAHHLRIMAAEADTSQNKLLAAMIEKAWQERQEKERQNA